MSVIKFTVPGEPTGKARPRVTKWGVHTPEKTVNYETLVKEMFAVKYPEHKPFDGAVRMMIIAYFSIPKSASRKKISEMVSGGIRPTKKPDVDNILKIVGDALNGFAYKDDSQVVSASISKHYTGGAPKVEVEIQEEG